MAHMFEQIFHSTVWSRTLPVTSRTIATGLLPSSILLQLSVGPSISSSSTSSPSFSTSSSSLASVDALNIFVFLIYTDVSRVHESRIYGKSFLPNDLETAARTAGSDDVTTYVQDLLNGCLAGQTPTLSSKGSSLLRDDETKGMHGLLTPDPPCVTLESSSSVKLEITLRKSANGEQATILSLPLVSPPTTTSTTTTSSLSISSSAAAAAATTSTSFDTDRLSPLLLQFLLAQNTELTLVKAALKQQQKPSQVTADGGGGGTSSPEKKRALSSTSSTSTAPTAASATTSAATTAPVTIGRDILNPQYYHSSRSSSSHPQHRSLAAPGGGSSSSSSTSTTTTSAARSSSSASTSFDGGKRPQK